MPRVLHVVSYFPPDRMGGVGEVVAHVHRALQVGGHDSLVLTAGASRSDPSVRRIASSPGGFCLAAARYASLAREAEVVHIHHGEGLGLLAAMRARGIDTPVLLTLHVSIAKMRNSLGPYRVAGNTFHRDSLPGWFHRQATMRLRWGLDRMAMALADRVTFISRSAAADVLGPEAASRAAVVYNGVSPAAPGEGEPLPPFELLFVGANSERKRVELLPLILSEVRRQRPGARLRIVGFNRDENPEVESLSRRLGVQDAIEYAGRLRSRDLGHYYRSAQALLVPSAYEGLPMVILEAMQYGLPVVATHVSGHPEVIEDGVSGLLVPLDNPLAMASAATRLLHDPSLAKRLAIAGQSVVAGRFSVEGQVAAYLAEYENLIRGRRLSS